MEGTVKTKRVPGIALEKSGKIRRLRTKPWCNRVEQRKILKNGVVGETKRTRRSWRKKDLRVSVGYSSRIE